MAVAVAPEIAIRPVDSAIQDDAAGEPRLSLRPVRFRPVDADPGTPLRFTLTATNSTSVPVTITPSLLPVQGSSDPEEFATIGDSESRSVIATTWTTFPGFGESRVLAAGSELKFPALVSVPANARPGTYALALGYSVRVNALGSESADAPASRVRLQAGPSSVAVIRVAGDAVPEARLTSIEAPRFVWGGSSPRFTARVANVGDTDLVIDGKVDLNAFIGTASRTLDAAGPAKGQPTLPEGVRDLKMRWSDPPLLGWFQPELVVVGGKGSGVRISKDLDTVYVLPPWWLILLVVVAIWLPVRAARRRRHDPDAHELRSARAKHKVEKRLARDRARRRAEDARRGRR
jgi:hypothetical protein